MSGRERGRSRQGLVSNVWDYRTVFWETEGKYCSPRGNSWVQLGQDLSSEPTKYAADCYFKLCLRIVVAAILTHRPIRWGADRVFHTKLILFHIIKKFPCNLLNRKRITVFTGYDIWYDMIDIWYDMIYLLTAIWLTPGGSSTVHIYTQTIHRTKQFTN